MKTILLPTDFSKNSHRAITYAVRLFGKTDTKYILLHSFQVPSAGQHVLISLDELIREEAEKDIAELRRNILDAEGLAEDQLVSLVQHSSVVTAVNRVSREHNADVVIMGTKGASGVLEKWMGSNAAAVIRDCEVPVIAVPHDAPLKIPHRIALAADQSEANNCLDWLSDSAHTWGASVMIFHVNTGTESEEIVVENEAHEGYGEAFGDVSAVYCTVTQPSVEEGIDHFLRSQKADMLAMVAHKRGFFSRLFHKSMTRRMSMEATIPLLILKDCP